MDTNAKTWTKISFATLLWVGVAAFCAHDVYNGFHAGVVKDRLGHLVHADQAPVRFWLHLTADLGAAIIGTGLAVLFVSALVSLPADRRKTRRMTMQALAEPPAAVADARLPPRLRGSP